MLRVLRTTVLTAALGALAVLAGALTWQTWSGLRTSSAAVATPDTLLIATLAPVAGLLAGWLAVCVLLAGLAQGRGALAEVAAGTLRRVAPRALRVLAVASVGAAVGLGPTVGAASADAGLPVAAAASRLDALLPAEPWTAPSAPSTARSAAAAATPTAARPTTHAARPTLPDPGWTPAPPVRVAAAAPVELVSSRAAAAPARADRAVVVHRGDTLWSIAARHLGPGAGADEVAAEWPRWYAANRAVIGADPDVLHPGQRLTPPSPRPAATDPTPTAPIAPTTPIAPTAPTTPTK